MISCASVVKWLQAERLSVHRLSNWLQEADAAKQL